MQLEVGENEGSYAIAPYVFGSGYLPKAAKD